MDHSGVEACATRWAPTWRYAWHSYEARLGNVGHAASEIGFARGDDVVVARVGDSGREDDGGRQIHLLGDRTGELGVRFEQRSLVLEAEDAAWIIETEQRPEASIDAN